MEEVILPKSDGGEANGGTEPPQQTAPTRPALQRGLLVFHPEFGFGKIVATQNGKVIVKFGRTERIVRRATDLVTLAEAVVTWHTYWLRGEKRRLKEGRLLWIIKSLCRRFGEWQSFLDRYDYPRSTADDLIRRYLTARGQHLPGNRSIGLHSVESQVHENTADPEADELEELVQEEAKKRDGRKPAYHPTLWSLRIKLPAVVLKLCRRKYKTEGRNCQGILAASSLQICRPRS